MMTANTTPGSSTMSLEVMLDLINNAPLYAKRLEELKEQENKTKEAIQNLTKATNIDEALKSAQQAETYAKARAKEANDKAVQIERDAQIAADAIVAEANQYKQNLERDLRVKSSELKDATINLTIASNHIESAKAELLRLRSDAEQLAQAHKQMRADIEAKRLQLQQLLG